MSVNGIEATVALCKYRKFYKVYGVRFERAGESSGNTHGLFLCRRPLQSEKAMTKLRLLEMLLLKRIIPAVHTAARISL